jgi:hypothetical protein
MILTICSEINKALLDYIFSDKTGKIVEVYAHLHIKIVDMSISFIKKMINGNKVLEDKLVKAFDCLRSFYIYFNRKSKIIHQKQHINNLKIIYNIS